MNTFATTDTTTHSSSLLTGKRGLFAHPRLVSLIMATGALAAVTATSLVARAESPQTEMVSIGGNPAFSEMTGGVSRNLPMSLEFGGFKRTFLVHVPAHPKMDDGHKMPLIVMLHAAGSDSAGAVRQTGWDRKADDESFIAVFPDALPTNPEKPASLPKNPRFWNDGSGRGKTDRGEIDDVGFLGAMLDLLAQRYPVDSNRIYVTGFASGASMTFRAASSPLAARIAAAAPISGYFYAAGTASQPRPVPLLLIVGTKDPVNPMAGGSVAPLTEGGRSEKPKVSDTVADWAKLDGCTGKPALISDKDGVKRLAYGPGKDGVEFLFWTIDGMGHQWPGSKTDKRPKSVIGEPTDKLTTDNIWTFLSRHTLNLRADGT